MDYTALLFALQVRDLAFKIMHNQNPDLRAGQLADDFDTYLRMALKEATICAQFVKDELLEDGSGTLAR